ncbi:MAG: hypothetical protein Q6370_008065 [Candidatus Sigynarchaeota archaeon]
MTAFSLLFLAVLPSFGHVVIAAGGQYVDTTDDIYVYTPEAYRATSCYLTSDYSSNDVSRVAWDNVSGSYIFNVTFQQNVNVSNISLILYFFANASYTSPADIPPYSFQESFFVEINTEFPPRCCYNYTYQKYFYSVHVHDGKTVEMTLSPSQTYILDPIQNRLPMDQWFCVGISSIKLDGAWGYDYINWPQRFNNDQLWLTYDPYYWHKIIAIGAVALGVVIVLTIILIKRNKGKNTKAANEKRPT